MSFTSFIDRKEDNVLLAIYDHHVEHIKSTSESTLSVVNDIQQLQTDFQAQYQHDKLALNELNQRFRVFIDRVQLLESQNSKYALQIAEFRQSSDFNNIDIQWSERYLNLQSDLTTISETKVDYEFDFELYQLQIGIYQQLIDLEQQWKDESRLKLEDELTQSSSVLDTLRASYAEIEREITILHAAREDIFKKYLKVTNDWCSAKKQRKKWGLSIKTLKSQLLYYKTLRSYSVKEFEVVNVGSIDLEQFWSIELDKCVKKIRHDFELLYATFYREMTAYYQTKIEEMQKDVQQSVDYQQTIIDEIAESQQTLEIEYEEVQKSFSYQKTILVELETTYSKLESELKSIQLRHEEQFEIQTKELHSAQESIAIMVYDIDEMRRSANKLEAEIIIYRHLLDSSEIKEQVVIVRQPQSVISETMEKIVVETESKRKGSIGIKECATNGKYIALANHSTNKDIDISKWVLKRRIDSADEVQYILPEGIRLERGKELIIYSKIGVDLSLNRAISSLSNQELVCNDLASWGMGNTTETYLFNQNGEEKASRTQWIVFEQNNI